MIYKAYAKVNIFLKIVGTRGDYHELVSRFIRVENLYDELKFSDKKEDCEFELVGDFGCDLKSNTIFKAYKAPKSVIIELKAKYKSRKNIFKRMYEKI